MLLVNPTSNLPAVIPADEDGTLSASPRQRLLGFLNDAVESPALRDGLKLILVGGALAAARRGFEAIFAEIYRSEAMS